MDSFSSSVSTMKVSAPPLHHESYLLKNPTTSHHRQQKHVLPPTTTTTKPNNNLIFNNKTTSFNLNTYYSPISSSSSNIFPNKSSTNNTHQNPATGYAAALIDIAQCNNSLQQVNRDVQILSNLLRTEGIQAVLIDPFVGVLEKGELVKEVVKRGSFDKNLVALVKMLIDKKKSFGIVKVVLFEFQRIYYHMNGYSSMKME
ncbi:hypothetical protein ACFE04_016836 [Oxalis oulophora]